MAVESTTHILTAEQFLAADLGGGTFELVRGEVVRMSPPSPEHGLICGNVAGILWEYGRRTGVGYCLSNRSPLLTERDPDTIRRPDLAFYTHARWPREQVDRGLPPEAPELAIEVSTEWSELGTMLSRAGEYLYSAGVALVWIVYSRGRTIVLYRPREEAPILVREHQAIEDLPELPGFRCLVSDVFR